MKRHPRPLTSLIRYYKIMPTFHTIWTHWKFGYGGYLLDHRFLGPNQRGVSIWTITQRRTFTDFTVAAGTGIGSLGSKLAVVLVSAMLLWDGNFGQILSPFSPASRGYSVSWTMITVDSKLDEVTTVNYSTSSIKISVVQEVQGAYIKTAWTSIDVSKL